MQSRKFNSKINNDKNWSIPLLTILGLILLLVPLTWLGLHNWSMEESLTELGYVKKDIDASPEEPDLSERTTPSIIPEDREDPSEQQPEQPVKPIQDKPVEKEEEPIDPVETPSAIEYEPNQALPLTPTIIEGILIANKHYPLPSTYAPGESKEAKDAFNKMAAAAKLDGFELVAFSTYRSFE